MASWTSPAQKKNSRSDMDNFEIQEVLKSFEIIADSREQNTPRARERFASFGVPVQRATLSYGDYCGNITLPDGALYDTSNTLSPACVIERKMSADEAASCFTRGRDRFQREFERAASKQSKVYLLIENASWESIMNHRYRSKYHPAAFLASLTAWSIRYNLTPIFCKSQTSGRLIKEILYRDIKERLERGEFG